jgi:hypothetical protein
VPHKSEAEMMSRCLSRDKAIEQLVAKEEKQIQLLKRSRSIAEAWRRGCCAFGCKQDEASTIALENSIPA